MKQTKLLLLSLVALIFVASISCYGADFSGKVVGISDGDTISVMHNGREEKIRLHGIDSPESGQPFGSKAKQFTSSLAFRQVVLVKIQDYDRYGRTVGIVVLPDGTILNQLIVKAGFAWWYKQYAPSDEILPKLEQEARKAKRGLWADPKAIPPWEFRHPEKSSVTTTTTTSTDELKRPAEENTNRNVTVYATRTGSKYHAAGCRYLAKSSIPISLDEAAKRYSPCSVCNPPRPTAAVQGTSSVEEQQEKGISVYVTRTGSKYHRAGCRYLRSSSIPISLSGAKQRYSPCSVCNPP